ncbi:MAG: SH3 domain-containing protein [Gammaproteobacteria bacterium]|nr:SH3 domain-containing protein [Gammaproteobacteria bacterium]
MAHKTTLVVFISLLIGVAAAQIAWSQSEAYTAASVNLRAGPGIEYEKVVTIPKGVKLTVQQCIIRRYWCHVHFKRTGGWVSSKFLYFEQTPIYVTAPAYNIYLDRRFHDYPYPYPYLYPYPYNYPYPWYPHPYYPRHTIPGYPISPSTHIIPAQPLRPAQPISPAIAPMPLGPAIPGGANFPGAPMGPAMSFPQAPESVPAGSLSPAK